MDDSRKSVTADGQPHRRAAARAAKPGDGRFRRLAAALLVAVAASAFGAAAWAQNVTELWSSTNTLSFSSATRSNLSAGNDAASFTTGSGGVLAVTNSSTVAATAPGAPTGLAAAPRLYRIDLSWTAPADNGGSAITGYKIEVSADGGSSWSDRVANTGDANTTYSHTGLARGTTRHYRVSAINTNGTGDASNVANATTWITRPGAPTGLTATASWTTQINLSWTAPADNGGSAIITYVIDVSPDGITNWRYRAGNVNAVTTYSQIGLAPGTTRHYRVVAINANGWGPNSNTANATTGHTAVTFGASLYTAVEGGATATVEVQLSAAPSAPVTIPLEVTHQGGATEADYSGIPANVMFGANQTEMTFTVTATADTDAETGESVSIGFGTLPDGVFADTTATVTLADGRGPGPGPGPGPTDSDPTVTISTTASAPVTGPFTVTVVFSESVSGFELEDLVVENGVASELNGNGTTFTAKVTPEDSGTVTVDIGAGAAEDSAGNPNTAAARFSIAADTAASTVTITSTATEPVNAPFPITIVFSEPVTGFELDDLVVENGTASELEGDEASYIATITPAASTSDTVTVDIEAGAAEDAAGNPSEAAEQFSIVADTAAPTVTLSTTASAPVTGPFTVTVVFSESVSGFELEDLVVGNGGASELNGNGTTFTAKVTPEDSGTVTVDIGAGAAEDSAGNPNTAAARFSIAADTAASTVTITSTATEPVNAPFPITIVFSEPVTGFELDDLVVENGTASELEGDEASYIATITPAASTSGTVTVDIEAGAAEDAAGNPSEAAEQFSIVADTAAPTVTLSTTASAPVTGQFTVTVVFSESVSGFELEDLVVGNGVASELNGNGTTFTAKVTPEDSGTVTVDIGAGAAEDSAGNPNTAAARFSIAADTAASTVTITSTATEPVNAPFPITIVFSEPVTGFELDDLVVENGTASELEGDEASYIATITPAASTSDTVTVDIEAGAAEDAAGNPSEAAEQFSIVADTAAPTVTLSTTASAPVTGQFTVTVVFSESVSGFELEDLVVGNGVASELNGNGTTFTAKVTPEDSGTVTVDIGAGAAEDSAGNPNTAAARFSIAADTSASTVTITSTATEPVNAPFPITIVFSEPVTGFELDDLVVENGTASELEGDEASYTATITPAASTSDIVTVDIEAGAAEDAAGNPSEAAEQFSIVADTAAPTVTLSTTASAPVTGQFTVTVVFSESVSGFELEDLVVGNGVASELNGNGTTFTAKVTPEDSGTVTVDIGAGAAEDSAGNPNTAAARFSIAADTSASTVTITSTATEPVNAPFPITIVFSEPVTGFELDDLVVENGTASELEGDEASYTATITPAASTSDIVTVDIEAGAAEDAAGNPSEAAEQFSIVADTAAPTVTLSTTASAPVTGPFTVTVVFSESVNGFELSDLVVGNGVASDLRGNGTTFTATITPAASGTVTVDIPAGAAEDYAGNESEAASRFSIAAELADTTAPTVTISTAASAPVNGPFTVTFTFSEEVTGFELEDLVVGNGVASELEGNGARYTATVTPTASGPVTVDIAAGAAEDSAGNPSTAADQFSITAELTPVPALPLAGVIALAALLLIGVIRRRAGDQWVNVR